MFSTYIDKVSRHMVQCNKAVFFKCRVTKKKICRLPSQELKNLGNAATIMTNDIS